MNDKKPLAQIVVIPSDSSDATVSELRKAGYIPIRTDDVSRVKLIAPSSAVEGGDMLMAAIHGLLDGSHASDCRDKFMAEMFSRMKLREKKP